MNVDRALLANPLGAREQLGVILDASKLFDRCARGDEPLCVRGVAVAKADAEGLDPSVEALADAMVGAAMGKRKNPFQGLSPHAPGAMKELAYADEVKAVRELTEKVRAAKSTAALTKALDACDATAATVTAKLKALTLAQTRYEVALSARDKLLPAWSRSLARLKKKAAGAWVDEEETYRAVFAAPDAVRAPVAKRPKKPGTPK